MKPNYLEGVVEVRKDLGEKRKLTQGQFNAILIGAVILVAAVLLLLIPGVAVICGNIILIILKVVWVLVIVTMILIGPGIIMWFLRAGIDKLDEQTDEEVSVYGWVHVMICIVFSIVLAVVWVVWGVRFLVDLPSWIHDMYVNLGWLTKMHELLPWGWGISALITAVLGYIFGSAENRDYVANGM